MLIHILFLKWQLYFLCFSLKNTEMGKSIHSDDGPSSHCAEDVLFCSLMQRRHYCIQIHIQIIFCSHALYFYLKKMAFHLINSSFVSVGKKKSCWDWDWLILSNAFFFLPTSMFFYWFIRRVHCHMSITLGWTEWNIHV